MTPAIIVGLLVVLLTVALVLDIWWADNASAELERTSESAALAAGRALVSDDLLKDDPKAAERRLQRARREAIRMAEKNQVAGRPVRLDAHSQRDIRFGRFVHDADTGQNVFVKSPDKPNTVAVTTHRNRGNGNPVARLFRGITGRSGEDMSRTAEVTADNHVVGLRPYRGVDAPLWPIAIADVSVSDSHGSPLDFWSRHIERRGPGRMRRGELIRSRGGRDDYSWDERHRRVVDRPDGIPEMVLRCGDRGSTLKSTNVKLVDLGTGLQPLNLDHQMQHGVSAAELSPFRGELRFDGRPLEINAFNDLPIGIRRRLSEQVGRCRIALLYSSFTPTNRNGVGRIRSGRIVAARVMAVRAQRDGSCEIVIQPGTLVTRTALLADPSLPAERRERFRNRYIYKLQVTR